MMKQRQQLTEELRSIQRDWRTEDADTPERWFSTLELESVTIEPAAAVFVLRDPKDGAAYGWRWRCLTDAQGCLETDLIEDLNESLPTEPDMNGVRWLGVHVFLGEEDTPHCPRCGSEDTEPCETYPMPARDGHPPLLIDWRRCHRCIYDFATVRYPESRPRDEVAAS